MLCELNAVLIRWDNATIAELEAELTEIESALTARRMDSQRLTDEISQGFNHFDGVGNQLADGGDLYHCVVAGLEHRKGELQAKLAGLRASTAFAMRTQSVAS